MSSVVDNNQYGAGTRQLHYSHTVEISQLSPSYAYHLSSTVFFEATDLHRGRQKNSLLSGRLYHKNRYEIFNTLAINFLGYFQHFPTVPNYG